MYKADFIVAGGGCVGLATAYQLLKKFPQKRVLVLEKDYNVAKHQTGRNSGVIHSGIYYKPGSQKAINCRKGKEQLEGFCKQHSIPFQTVGKLIVATNNQELLKLPDLASRGEENGIQCRILTPTEMHEIEPHVAGVGAIHVPETSIVDYKQVCKVLVTEIQKMGGTVYCGEKVSNVDHRGKNIEVESYNGMLYRCKCFINCGGAYADDIAKRCSYKPSIQIIPFRGEYYTLTQEAKHFIKGLIYPVPDPQFPFLGVHFTKTINGGVECGPNAVLAFGKESYEKFQINFAEFYEIITFPGFWRLLYKHWTMGIHELCRSFNKKIYTESLKKLVPMIEMHHLVDNRPAGIRAQAVDRNGNLVDDFLIETQDDKIVHVLNAPSPAATACLPIGEYIVEKVDLLPLNL